MPLLPLSYETDCLYTLPSELKIKILEYVVPTLFARCVKITELIEFTQLYQEAYDVVRSYARQHPRLATIEFDNADIDQKTEYFSLRLFPRGAITIYYTCTHYEPVPGLSLMPISNDDQQLYRQMLASAEKIFVVGKTRNSPQPMLLQRLTEVMKHATNSVIVEDMCLNLHPVFSVMENSIPCGSSVRSLHIKNCTINCTVNEIRVGHGRFSNLARVFYFECKLLDSDLAQLDLRGDGIRDWTNDLGTFLFLQYSFSLGRYTDEIARSTVEGLERMSLCDGLLQLDLELQH